VSETLGEEWDDRRFVRKVTDVKYTRPLKCHGGEGAEIFGFSTKKL
jgi:hypothetical protein